MGSLPCLGILCLVFGSSLGENLTWRKLDEKEDSISPMAILDQSLLAENYDKRVLPRMDRSFVVGVSMYILELESVDMINMDITWRMYFRQFWNDPRLAFEKRPWVSQIVGGKDIIDRIWLPDTFFVNSREVESSNSFMRITHTGDVLWSQLMKVRFTCPMDLTYFPFDSQLCTLEVESFAYTMSSFKYSFQDGMNSIQLSPDVSLPQFGVIGHRQRIIEASLSSGNYSRLLGDIQLTRYPGYFTLAFFVPVSVLVMTTWTSFWINPAYPAAKLSLLVPPLIIMLGVIGGIQFLLVPFISYTTALIIYSYMSLTMILFAFVPFILVTVLHVFFKEKSEAKNKKFWTHPVFITDTICKFLFPIVFVIIQYYFFKSYTKHGRSYQDLIYLHDP